jgi:Tfp pilus assembly protein PilO
VARITPRLTRRERTLVVLAGLLFVAYFYYALVWSPLNQAVTQAAADAESRRVYLEQLQVLSSRRAEYESRAKAAVLELERLQERLPAALDQAKLLNYLQAAAEQVGISLTAVNAEPPVADGELVRIPLQICARGLYPALGAFVACLETMPLVTGIDSVFLTVSTGVSLEEFEEEQVLQMPAGERVIDMRLDINVFIRPPAGGVAPGGTQPAGSPPAGVGRLDPFSVP